MTFISPASRFHRIIKKLARSVVGQEHDVLPDYKALIQTNESLIGVYCADARIDDLLFTDKGVIFMDYKNFLARRITYADIDDVDFPLPVSDSVLLTLQLSDSSLVSIKVVGQQGNFRDVFEVGRFFMRVVEDERGKSI